MVRDGNPRGAPPLHPEDLSRLAAEALGGSPLPALVLEIPAERIVAASLRAAQMLDPTGGQVVGRILEDFTADRAAAGADLFAGGRLNGFETFRVLRRPHSTDVKVRMWVRSFDHQPSSRYVLVVIVADHDNEGTYPAADWQDAPAVVGTADSSLLIERISSDAEVLFGRSVADLIGQSLIGVVAATDVPTCLTALAEASATQRGVTVTLDIKPTTGDSARGTLACEVLILPLNPSPSCAFVFVPTAMEGSGIPVSNDLSAILVRLGRGAEIAQLARGVFTGVSERDIPGLSRLTTRELEIVTGLLEGSRVPVIAGRLFLSQSTVRNHLASVFGKLGVSSQQELLDLFRAVRAADDTR